MQCKYYNKNELKCTIANEIPSHPEYCKEKPENCPAFKLAEEMGIETAIKVYREK